MGSAIVGFLRVFFGPLLVTLFKVVKFGALRKVAGWAALSALIAGLYIAVNAVIIGISIVMPHYVVVGASWIIPDNFSACVTAYLAGTTLISLYRWQREGILFAAGGR